MSSLVISPFHGSIMEESKKISDTQKCSKTSIPSNQVDAHDRIPIPTQQGETNPDMTGMTGSFWWLVKSSLYNWVVVSSSIYISIYRIHSQGSFGRLLNWWMDVTAIFLLTQHL